MRPFSLIISGIEIPGAELPSGKAIVEYIHVSPAPVEFWDSVEVMTEAYKTRFNNVEVVWA